MKAKTHLKLNVNYSLKDKNGNEKSIFQQNKFFTFLIKHGFLSVKALKIPFLFGNWKSSMNISNMVTNAGKAAVAGLMTGDVTNFFDYIAVGTGTTAAALTDTALQTEIVDSGLERAVSTNSRVTTDVTNDTAQFVKTFTITGTKAVTESGVLDSASTGVLLARQVFSAINVASGDSLQITWKIDVD